MDVNAFNMVHMCVSLSELYRPLRTICVPATFIIPYRTYFRKHMFVLSGKSFSISRYIEKTAFISPPVEAGVFCGDRIKDGDSSQIQRLISVTTMGKLHFTDVITKTVGKKIDIFPAQAAFHRPDPVMVRQTEPTVHHQIRLGGRNSLPLQDFPDHPLPGGNRAANPPCTQIVRRHTASRRQQLPSHLRSNAGDLAGDRINFDHCDDIVFCASDSKDRSGYFQSSHSPVSASRSLLS